MTLETFTEEQIMKDVTKLQYLFKLKEVTRYNTPREMADDTESVAEHLYGMHLLAQYFLPLEDLLSELDHARVYRLITIHDFDEIETGDYVSYIKTDAHRIEAEQALPIVLEHVPEHIKESITTLSLEYEEQSSPEARFVKAIDKIEPLLQVFNEKGRLICHRNKCTAEDSLRIKSKYIEPYPFIKKFALTVHQTLVDGGYYWREGA
jgi:putative hydrolases of HD superfamily